MNNSKFAFGHAFPQLNFRRLKESMLSPVPPVTSLLISSTMSCLLHCLNLSANFRYVALSPSFSLHLYSIPILCRCIDWGASPIISCSSAGVSPRKGATSLHWAINVDMCIRWSFEHFWSHNPVDRYQRVLTIAEKKITKALPHGNSCVTHNYYHQCYLVYIFCQAFTVYKYM